MNAAKDVLAVIGLLTLVCTVAVFVVAWISTALDEDSYDDFDPPGSRP